MEGLGDLTRAQEAAAGGVFNDILTAHETDQVRRQNAIDLDGDIQSTFPPADWEILQGPPPQYAQGYIDQDRRHDSYICPILREVPDPSRCVKWMGYGVSIPTGRHDANGREITIQRIFVSDTGADKLTYLDGVELLCYDMDMVQNLRQRKLQEYNTVLSRNFSGWKSPMNVPVTQEQFLQSPLQPLTLREQQEVAFLVQQYPLREAERSAWQKYKALQDEYQVRLRAQQNRQDTRDIVRANGGTTQASPVTNFALRAAQQAAQDADPALLENDDEVQYLSPEAQRINRGLAGLFGNDGGPINFSEDDDDDDDDGLDLEPMPPLRGDRRTYASRDRNTTNNATNNATNSTTNNATNSTTNNATNNRTRRRGRNTNRNANSTNGRANPLEEDNSTRVALPRDFWGTAEAPNPEIEQAALGILVFAENLEGGWITLARRKVAFFEAHTLTLFRQGQCLERYRKVSHGTLRKRYNDMEKHYNELITNHSADQTGMEGETTRPLWFDKMQQLKQFSDSTNQNSRAEQNRENMRTVQGNLGTVQRPLGPGEPGARSEIAAENPATRRGSFGVGAGLEVRPVDDQSQADGGSDDTSFTLNDNNDSEQSGAATGGGGIAAAGGTAGTTQGTNTTATTNTQGTTTTASTTTARRGRSSTNDNNTQRRRQVRRLNNTPRPGNVTRPGNSRSIMADVDERRDRIIDLADAVGDVARSMTAVPQPPVGTEPNMAIDIANLGHISDRMTTYTNQLVEQTDPRQLQNNNLLYGVWHGMLQQFASTRGINQQQGTLPAQPRARRVSDAGEVNGEQHTGTNQQPPTN